MIGRSLRSLSMVAAAAGAVAASGCGSDPTARGAGDGVGTIAFGLTSTAGTTRYVLANATFAIMRIQPPSDVALRLQQSDPTASDLTASVEVGRYTVALFDGWQLQREDAPGRLVPVEGTLQSMNPVTLSVLSGQTTSVTFQFQTTGVPLTFGPGALDIGAAVDTCDAAPPAGVELNVVANHSFEVNAEGWRTLGDRQLTLSDEAHCGLHSAKVVSTGFTELALFDLPEVGTNKFAVSAWMKLQDANGPGSVVLYTQGSEEGCLEAVDSRTVPSGVWTRLAGTVALTAGCTKPLVRALAFHDDTDPGNALFVDDVYAIPQ